MKPEIVAKAKQTLCLVLIVLLFLNLRFIFNFDQIKDLAGFREFNTWSLYAFDLAYLALIFTIGIEFVTKKISRQEEIFDGLFKTLINSWTFYFIIYVWIRAFSSDNQPSSFYFSARITQATLMLPIFKNLLSDKLLFLKATMLAFFAGIVESIFGIIQFSKQESIGMAWLGESVISSQILGVAKFELAGTKLIRAYGTFPHPNIFAIFLIFSLACGIWLTIVASRLKGKPLFGISIRTMIGIGMAIICFGLLVSYSRGAWAAAFVLFSFLIFRQRYSFILFFEEYLKKRRYLSASLFAFGLFFFLMMYSIVSPRLCTQNCPGDSSISLRKAYNNAAQRIIYENPVFGVGPANSFNFITRYSPIHLNPWEKQPIHNIYLTAAADIGIIGLILFAIVVIQELRKNQSTIFTLLFTIFLLLGLIDHYFVTTPQAMMLFWLSLAFLASSSRIESKIKTLSSERYEAKKRNGKSLSTE